LCLALNKVSSRLIAAHLKAVHMKYHRKPARLLIVARYEYRNTSGTVLFDVAVKK
jgi:hypothetical protein